MHQHWGTLEKRTPLYKNYSGQIQRRNPQAKIKRGRNLHGRCQRICHGRASHSPTLSPPTPCTQKHRPEREDEREMTETDRGRTRGGLHAALLATDSRVWCCTVEAKFLDTGWLNFSDILDHNLSFVFRPRAYKRRPLVYLVTYH